MPRLLDLPLEILWDVVDALPHHVIPDLSLCSSGCYAIAKYRLWQSVRIRSCNKQHLAEYLLATIDRREAWTCIRRIIIDPEAVYRLFEKSPSDSGNPSFETLSNTKQPTEDWLSPLIEHFIRHSPGLRDLWFHQTDLPLGRFLEVVTQYRPRCRVTLPSPTLSEIPDHLRGPINCISDFIDADLAYNVTRGRVDQNMADLPSLRDAFVIHSRRPTTLFNTKKLLASAMDEGPRIPLRMFGIGGARGMDAPFLNYWYRKVDFSKITELELKYGVLPEGFHPLTRFDFSSLTKLRLDLPCGRRPELSSRLATTFLCSLAPLSKLVLRGQMPRERLREVINHHGTTLGELRIEAAFKSSQNRLALNADDIRHIAARCESLTDAEFTIERSGADAQESLIYRHLGQMPKLTNIVLYLDGLKELSALVRGEPLGPDPSSDEFDMSDFDDRYSSEISLCKGLVRRMLTEAALDQHLALAIFHLISEERQCPGALPLQRLVICSHPQLGHSKRFSRPLFVLFDELCRSWLLERTLTAEHEPGVGVYEYPKSKDSVLERVDRATQLEGDTDLIFQKIWPGQGHWRDRWRSQLPERYSVTTGKSSIGE